MFIKGRRAREALGLRWRNEYSTIAIIFILPGFAYAFKMNSEATIIIKPTGVIHFKTWCEVYNLLNLKKIVDLLLQQWNDRNYGMSGIKTPTLCQPKLNIALTLIKKCYPNAFKVVKGLKTYQKSQHTWETACPHAWLQPCSTQRSTDSWRGEQRSTFKEKGEVEEFQCAPAARTSFLHVQFLQYLQYLFA